MRTFGTSILILALFAPPGAGKPNPGFADADALLASFEGRSHFSGNDYTAVSAFMSDLAAAVESDMLRTGTDYFRAGRLASLGAGEFRENRISYECFLTSAALDYPEAVTSLPKAWDLLLVSMSRAMRMDLEGTIEKKFGDELFELDMAPESIRRVWRDPAFARRLAEGATDNEEVFSIEEADQADRKIDWSTLSPLQIQDIKNRDRIRRQRITEALVASKLTTANDFARAALVMQHGRHFRSFQLAHELAVCALLIGDDGVGRWLVAATYDRMMYSMGHRQRFGTQDGVVVDEEGICRSQRATFGVLPSR